jgi:hypothetical protein
MAFQVKISSPSPFRRFSGFDLLHIFPSLDKGIWPGVGQMRNSIIVQSLRSEVCELTRSWIQSWRFSTSVFPANVLAKHNCHFPVRANWKDRKLSRQTYSFSAWCCRSLEFEWHLAFLAAPSLIPFDLHVVPTSVYLHPYKKSFWCSRKLMG